MTSLKIPAGLCTSKRYNISPGDRVGILTVEEGVAKMEALTWGVRPFWVREKNWPSTITARMETAASSKIFGEIWKNGRAVILADGWYACCKGRKARQHYYFNLQSEKPLFIAAIGYLRERALKPYDGDGFVIVTTESKGSMADIHDRSPLILSAELVREWMDPDTSEERLVEIIQECLAQPDVFKWHPVSNVVNSVKHDGQDLVKPKSEDLD
ncbi:hypothetical protein EHI8A_034350 [Entamoeba histolytica HM-1:IMSS-B]|nr:hypothetical protein EHI8A_034350 [Entamoeba histolytica HM-1:IMSS-B]